MKSDYKKLDNDDIEIKLLLEAIYLKYGYDFRNYSKGHIKRRVMKSIREFNLESISDMQHKLLVDRSFFENMLHLFSINVTEMFRDPSFFLALRKEVIPVLKTYPRIKIWHAGCSTGEEVYTMSIILKEEGLLSKSQIYATDINESILNKAREGIYHIDTIKEYNKNYLNSNGTDLLSNYYKTYYDYVHIDSSIKQNIIFAEHNLVTDGVFGEMNLILCRNVLIYFNRQLQNKVIRLFYDSLCKGGFLTLGSKETIQFSNCEDCFESIVETERIYKKKFN